MTTTTGISVGCLLLGQKSNDKRKKTMMNNNTRVGTAKMKSSVALRAAFVITALFFLCIGNLLGSTLKWNCGDGNRVANAVNSILAVSSAQPTIIPSSFQLAYEESLGFFTDISDTDWSRMKQRVADVQPNTCDYCRMANFFAPAWFQNNYEPDFTCRHERRVGRLGDGGKWMCDPHLIPKDNCLVYSVGSNGEFSFEKAILETLGCEVHTFDMANYTEGALKVGSNFHQWGIDRVARKDHKGIYKTLEETLSELGHTGRTIDVFKIDCEGCEWTSHESWFQADVTLRQILIELHANSESQMPMPASRLFFENMYNQSYVIFHKEPNIHYSRYGWAVEYAFLKLNQTFFHDISPTTGR